MRLVTFEDGDGSRVGVLDGEDVLTTPPCRAIWLNSVRKVGCSFQRSSARLMSSGCNRE